MEIPAHTQYMQIALKEGENALEHRDVPIGAVIVKNGKILGRAHNQVELLKDPTAHAEMLAITQAVATIGEKFLTDATIYVTVEPCPMCMGALLLSRIKNLVYGAHDPKLGACGSKIDVAMHRGLNHYVTITSGIESEKAQQLLGHFFSKVRSNGLKTGQ